MKDRINIGDTITLYSNGERIASGIVYICSAIPMGKFYSKYFEEDYFVTEDIFEEALVLIDSDKPGTLTVLTLEDQDCKMFSWGDVFISGVTDYRKLGNPDSIDVVFSNSVLTEMVNVFK